MSSPPTKEKTNSEVSYPIQPDRNGHIYDDDQIHRATVLKDGSVHLLQGRFQISGKNVKMLPPQKEEEKQ